jgi:hypothetical protein
MSDTTSTSKFYDPFSDFLFEEDVCFLSGQKLDTSNSEKCWMSVWLPMDN